MLHGSSVGCTEANHENTKVNPEDCHERFCINCANYQEIA